MRVQRGLVKWIFNFLINQLRMLKAIKAEEIAVDSTLIKAYAKPRKDCKCSDIDAKWGYDAMGRRVLGYKVHLACDADAELPLSFKVTGANVHDSKEYHYLLNDIYEREMKFRHVIADAGYDSKENYELTIEKYGAIPIIAPNRRNAKGGIEEPLEGWKDLYRKRASIERVFSRLKEELYLKTLKVRGLWRVTVHVSISLITMLSVAVVAVRAGN